MEKIIISPMVRRSHNPEDFTNPQEYTLDDYLVASLYLKNRKDLLTRDDIAEDKKKRVNSIILGMRYFQKTYHLEIENLFDIDAVLASASHNISDIDILSLVPRPTGNEVLAVVKPQWKEAQKKYEQLATMLNETSIGCWLLEFHNGTIHILNVNEAICKMLGFPEEEIIGKNIHDFLDQRSRTELDAQSRDIFTEKHREFTLDLPRSDGTKLPVKIGATSLGVTAS